MVFCASLSLDDRKLYPHYRSIAGIMRAIIALTVALLMLIPVMGVDVSYLSPESEIVTTESMAAFLNDSWTPSTFMPINDTAIWPDKNKTLANSTADIYGVLKGDWTPSKFEPPVDYAVWQNKDKQLLASGYAIYDFLREDWTPGSPVPIVQTGLYKLHQMN